MKTTLMDILLNKGIEINFKKINGILKSLQDKTMLYTFTGNNSFALKQKNDITKTHHKGCCSIFQKTETQIEIICISTTKKCNISYIIVLNLDSNTNGSFMLNAIGSKNIIKGSGNFKILDDINYIKKIKQKENVSVIIVIIV